MRSAGKSNKALGRADPPGRTEGGNGPPGIDLATERVVPLGMVPKLGLIPERRRGSRLNLRTVYRWATHGARGVKLATALVGGQRVTTVEALVRFIAAVSAVGGASKSASARSSRRPLPSDRVEAELDREGI